jgi:hypothetical protein
MTYLRHDKEWFVYVAFEYGADDSGPCKIGTANDVKYRLASLQNGNPRRLVIAAAYKFGNRTAALAVEKAIHAEFAEFRLPDRDWFFTDPRSLTEAIERRTGGRP